LTQSGVVYSRKIDGQTLTFGISGRLYKSNVLLYDHQSESLWSQLMNTAVSGPQAGKPLTALPSARVSWKKWKRLHPETMVLPMIQAIRGIIALIPTRAIIVPAA
jgi:hypothetical protein